jgi:hypothetical protein
VAHSNRDDHKKSRDAWRCVTTRGRRGRYRPPKRRFAPLRWPRIPSVSAADVPPRRAVGVPRDRPDVSAAAWRPASDGPPFGIPVPGSNAGCIAVPGTFVRSPCTGKPAIPAAGPWRRPPARQATLPAGTRLPVRLSRWYAAHVPWEAITPWGRPGRMPFILLGHSPIPAFLLSACRPATVFLRPCLGPRRKPEPGHHGRRHAREVAQRRKPGRTRTRCILALKDTKAGTPDIPPEVDAKKPRQRDGKNNAHKAMRARPFLSPKTRPSSSPLPLVAGFTTEVVFEILGGRYRPSFRN